MIDRTPTPRAERPDLPHQRDATATAVAAIEAKKASDEWDRDIAESRAKYEAEADR